MITWTKENIALLKKLYPINDNATIAAKLNTTERSIRSAAARFKLKKSNRYWSKKDTDFMDKNWTRLSAEEIAAKLKRTRWAVINKYREIHGLR